MLIESHRVLVTRGDFHPRNIMVKDENVAAIINWELSEWYPEYWEFAKALQCWYWQNDWTD
jgi:aminoglycoside phosphotransferase (APT) family kinase protein